MPQQQIAIRIPTPMLDSLDLLVAAGEFENRADGVRRGLELLLDVVQRRRTGEAIVEGYQRIPPTGEFDAWAAEAATAMIKAEPWPISEAQRESDRGSSES